MMFFSLPRLIWYSDFSRCSTCLVSSSMPLDYVACSALSSLFTYRWINWYLHDIVWWTLCRKPLYHLFFSVIKCNVRYLQAADQWFLLFFQSRLAQLQPIDPNLTSPSRFVKELKWIFVCAQEKLKILSWVWWDLLSIYRFETILAP